MQLRKEIPVAAGLGGGSSDGAAALVGLSRLWGLEFGCDRLLQAAAALGSDVPFFLYGGTALVEGRGERVEPLHVHDGPYYLLVNPGFAVSTAAVFRELRPTEWTDGSRTRILAAEMAARPNLTVGWNGLQAALFRLYPCARECFERVAALAPGRAIVSGSGPTVIALFPSPEAAYEACRALAPYGYWRTVTRTAIPEAWQTPCA